MDYNTIRIINISCESASLAIALALLVGLVIAKAYHTRLSRQLLYLVVVDISILGLDILSWALGEVEGWNARSIAVSVTFFVYVLSYMYSYLITLFVTTYIVTRNPDVSKIPLRFSITTSVLMTVLLLVNLSTGWLYYFDERNIFVPGALNIVSIGVAFIIMLVNLFLALQNRKHLGKKSTTILLMFLIIPMVASVFEVFFENIMFIYVGCNAAFVLLYVSIQIQFELNVLAQEKQRELELAEGRTAIMLSQIQPHFLYNSLTAIGKLCDIDPKLAKEAVNDFADYLRGNLDSLSKRDLIPFEDELIHVETYLALEQLRFGEKLQVAYEIETEEFRLPPLTVQPIVENAVRYGLTKRKPDGTVGGTVTVSVQERDNDYQIIIKDDGVGFDVTKPKMDGRGHIGIENVRGRLGALCNGELAISSAIGEGTTAIITIPKEM